MGTTLRSHHFKLLPFPDERPDSNSVCSTGVHSYPSASNIHRMSSVVWRDDDFKFFFFLPGTKPRLPISLFVSWPVPIRGGPSAPLLDTEQVETLRTARRHRMAQPLLRIGRVSLQSPGRADRTQAARGSIHRRGVPEGRELSTQAGGVGLNVSFFMGGRTSACEMRQRVGPPAWRQRRRVLSAPGNDRQQIREAAAAVTNARAE